MSKLSYKPTQPITTIMINLQPLKISFLTLLICSLAISGCKKDDEVVIHTLSVNLDSVNVDATSAYFYCSFITQGTVETVFLDYTTDPSFNSFQSAQMTINTNRYQVLVNTLKENTKYYYRYRVCNRYSKITSSVISFHTTTYSLPTIITTQPTDITYNTAVCGGNVTSTGGLATTKGICYATTHTPTIYDSYYYMGTETGPFSKTITGLKEGTTYYVRAYATNSKGTAYGEEIAFTTSFSQGIHNGHQWVDLGLPSGILWATCNVGAISPEKYGDYYAWGETTTKSTYSWNTYKYCKGSDDTMTKYCTNSNYGTVDNKSVLDALDDVAYVNWGGNWRMPTQGEYKELLDNCTATWTVKNSVYGRLLTSNKNGTSIFLPAAGYYDDTSLNLANSYGYYWSASSSYSYYAFEVYFHYSNITSYYNNERRLGFSVRPVCKLTDED